MQVEVTFLIFLVTYLCEIFTLITIKYDAANNGYLQENSTKVFRAVFNKALICAKKGKVLPVLRAQLLKITVREYVGIAIISVVNAAAAYKVMEIGNISFWAKSRVFLMLLVVTMSASYDAYVRIIPNVYIVITLIARTLIFIPEFYVNGINNVSLINALGNVMGAVVCFFVLLMITIITKDGVGMGDVKLMTVIAYAVSIWTVYFTVTIGVFACLIYAVIQLVLKRKSRKDKIAFGPFIYVGYVAVMLCKFL